jgi:hypothetical protein
MTYDQAVAVVKDAMGKKISASVDFVNVDEGYKEIFLPIARRFPRRWTS